MPRRAKDGIPGSVYAKRGYLYVSVCGVVTATRLPDTPKNRKIAGQLKQSQWLRHLMGHTVPTSTPTWRQAWEAYKLDTPNMHATTRAHYELAYKVLIRNPDAPVSDGRAVVLDWLKNPTGVSGARVSTVSQGVYIRGFRAFIRWAVRRYGLPDVDMRGLEPRARYVTPKFVSAEHWRAVAGAAGVYSAVFEFMLLTGARPVDVCSGVERAGAGQGIVWRNKITKEPEPRPVSSRAWELVGLLPPRIAPRVLARSWERAQRRAGVEPLPLKALRTGFLARIAPLPEHLHGWLMRHHVGGVTERHYRTYKWDEVIRLLDAIP